MSTIAGMNARIEILTASDAPDGAGGTIREWVSSSPPQWLWAKAEMPRRRKGTDAESVSVAEQMNFTIHRRPGLSETQNRVAYQGKQYAILSVPPDETGRYLVMEAEARRLP